MIVPGSKRFGGCLSLDQTTHSIRPKPGGASACSGRISALGPIPARRRLRSLQAMACVPAPPPRGSPPH